MKNCKTCPILTLPRQVSYNNLNIKLDFSLDCKSDNVIYIGRCKYHPALKSNHSLICKDEIQCYFGQTFNEGHHRFNGHRKCFKLENNEFEKSALSMHILNDHISSFSEKLHNFDFGIIKQVKPSMLDRTEDFYIWKTRADLVGLNRHKVRK